MEKRKLTRRDFLNISSATAAGVLLTACAPTTTTSTTTTPGTTSEAPQAAAPSAAEADTLTFATESPSGPLISMATAATTAPC